MFKRKKKKTEKEVAVDEIFPTPEDFDAEVAAEIAEEITIFESSKEESSQLNVDSPTIRVSDLKQFTDELVLAEVTDLLDDNVVSENNTPVEIALKEIEAEPLEDLSETVDEETIVEEEKAATEEISEEPSVEDEIDKTEEKTEIEPEKKKAKEVKPKKKKMSKFARRKKRKHRLQLMSNALMWIISLCLLTFCLSNLYQQMFNEDEALGFFKMGNAVVVSESMVPALEINDFIVYKATAIEQLRPQDVVVYKRPVVDGHVLIVHRLLAITDGYAITQGDNNTAQDEPFDAENIVGKVVLTIPQLGKVLDKISSITGIIVIAALFFVSLLTQIICRKLAYNMWLKKLAEDKEERKAIQFFLET